jgi:hypothetical protein
MRHAKLLTGSIIGIASVATSANAAVVTSTDFSIGYGFAASATWNTSETAGANTAIAGPFTLAIAPVSNNYEGPGATFPGRVLTSGVAPASNFSAAGNDGGGGPHPAFRVPITASYNGAAPGDASGTPNYQIQIEITSIGIYAGVNNGTGGSDQPLSFTETTPLHGNTSPATSVANSGNYVVGVTRPAANYTHVTWDPSDYSTSLANLNDTFTRTFSTDAPSSHVVFLDGLEITGRVHLIYDAVPEPSSLALLGLGGLFIRRRTR